MQIPKQIPHRTNATELTDDELLLFDFVFDKTVAFQHLRKDDYSFHMNCRYSHGLDDEALESTLASLVARSLLHHKIGPIYRFETRSFCDGDVYSLSEAGGLLWERERLPDWDRYLTTTQWQLGANFRGMIRVVCTDADIGRMCLGAMFATGLICPIGRLRVRMIRNARLLPWRSFSKVQSIRCKTIDDVDHSPVPTDWDVYNSMRCWWRDVHELDSLNRQIR